VLPQNYFSNPQDDWVAPIVAQLAVLTGQIAGIDQAYTEPPDAPEDNSVIFPLKQWDIIDSTVGKIKVRWTFEVQHLFRMNRLQDTLARASSFLSSWIRALTAWPNTDLGGLAITTDPKTGRFLAVGYGGNDFLALAHVVTVTTEYLIVTS
jgi:hypothetical protein